jgi:hypothetical protein
MHGRTRLGLMAAAAGFMAAGGGAARAQSVVVSWIQLGPGSSAAALAAGHYGDEPASATPTILARSIVSDGQCPKLTLDSGQALQMAMRFSAGALGALPAGSDQPGFFVDPGQGEAAHFAEGTAKATLQWAECEAVVPAGHVSAAIAGTHLKLPAVAPRTFLVLGDTGCRNLRQSCTDPMAFPGAYLSSYEAGFSPDLTVHVGDYLYRVKPGHDSAEPWGDDFDGWNADVFYPMKTLLQAAPVIFTRGNHESCGRGARGWYALLDPHPFDRKMVACVAMGAPLAASGDRAQYTADFEPSYAVKAGSLNFLVHDSSFPKDSAVDPAVAQNYDRDLTHLLGALDPHTMSIFVTHRPSFGLVSGGAKAPGTVHNWGNMTEQAVFSGGTSAASAFVHGVPPSIGLFLSGHVHQAQFIDLQDNAYYAPQLVVGMSGTLLDPDVDTGKVPPGNVDLPSFTEKAASFSIGHFDGTKGAAVARSAGTHDEFGFAVLHADTGADGRIIGFKADIYKLGTTKAGTCVIALVPRGLNCDF